MEDALWYALKSGLPFVHLQVAMFHVAAVIVYKIYILFT